ncbi:FliO/MopB family protein [Salinibacterium hongtaonis]|uniref:Flagellar biosynthetic protein FliO n=1 Tax=Homoserinimonas hongtaonis TaxID=2079791 RepID=A0A2U1T1R6_9MICO|nr:flagellar biosynthetic protein FliO [Salinibacterium hongtaonis]PWB97808.1 flagellar biosynthetic protein FliO [Salinibacterium hongtaonis]
MALPDMDALFVGLRVVVSLGVVLALLWYLQRRLSKGSLRVRKANPVVVVGRQTIGPKASVVVVDVEGSRLVLGVTDGAITMLQSAEAPQPADFEQSMDDAVATFSPLTAVEPLPAAEKPVPAAVAASFAGAGKGPLAGSILSPDTWRQAAAALRRTP